MGAPSKGDNYSKIFATIQKVVMVVKVENEVILLYSQ
jgi:hypothetical protein